MQNLCMNLWAKNPHENFDSAVTVLTPWQRPTSSSTSTRRVLGGSNACCITIVKRPNVTSDMRKKKQERKEQTCETGSARGKKGERAKTCGTRNDEQRQKTPVTTNGEARLSTFAPITKRTTKSSPCQPLGCRATRRTTRTKRTIDECERGREKSKESVKFRQSIAS